MAAPLMVNLDEIDQTKVEYTVEDLRKYLPQRFEFEQVTGIFTLLRDLPEPIAVGYRDIGHDEFWIPGHVPGRPLFPGVLMLEAAAQVSTFMYKVLSGDDPNRFLGFGGLEDVRFRGTVAPGDRLFLLAKMTEARQRRCTFVTQGVVNGRLVFDARVIGVPV
ncbi:MAG: beta-hydroxyacyl-ACP dehydratase [Proteobacteria bacterium]|nr:beta-hydroxyacyl-ACP dehydratase [Pseudomonadota bacterium]